MFLCTGSRTDITNFHLFVPSLRLLSSLSINYGVKKIVVDGTQLNEIGCIGFFLSHDTFSVQGTTVVSRRAFIFLF
jgi:hypothetical protein